MLLFQLGTKMCPDLVVFCTEKYKLFRFFSECYNSCLVYKQTAASLHQVTAYHLFVLAWDNDSM